MRGKIRWCCRPRCFQWTGKLNPCKPLLRCMHSRYCFCGPEHGLSHSSGVPCAPRQEDARPARPALPKFAVVRYKPDGDQLSSLAVLVYRLVCQPVTLESWVRLPDAAHESFAIARPPRSRGGTSTDRLRANTPASLFVCKSLKLVFNRLRAHPPVRLFGTRQHRHCLAASFCKLAGKARATSGKCPRTIQNAQTGRGPVPRCFGGVALWTRVDDWGNPWSNR